jgi:hypothetical protein
MTVDRIDPEDGHVWVLVSEEDPLETEVCVNCGAQRNRNGELPFASVTGGWKRTYEDCQRSIVEAQRAPGVLDA